MTDDDTRQTTVFGSSAEIATDVSEALHQALDGLLGARVLLGGLPPAEPPGEALDSALREDGGYQQARSEFRQAFESLMAFMPDAATRRLALGTEAACHLVLARAVEVGWRLGCLATQRGCGAGG